MTVSREYLIRQIHAAPTQVILVVAGGGARALSEMLEVPGASRTLLEAVVPYSEPAMAAFLGGRPDRFCAEPTARVLAMAAFMRARRFVGPAAPVAGVACTASLITDRPKRGAHRAHIAAQTADATMSWSVEMCKGCRDRQDEEQVVSVLVLTAIARACGLKDELEVELLAGERTEERIVVAEQAWQDLLLERVESVCCAGTPPPSDRRTRAIFPGAFHPMHVGHQRMADIAEARLKTPVELELSIVNVDKPPLDYAGIAQRVRQFPSDRTIWLTRAATFEAKTALFGPATFVVGADTLRRIGDLAYYGNDRGARQASLERIVAQGGRFLVFGRRCGDRIESLADLDIPAVLRDVCDAVPTEEFLEEVCSTDLRDADLD
jgi:hypothetical protein